MGRALIDDGWQCLSVCMSLCVWLFAPMMTLILHSTEGAAVSDDATIFCLWAGVAYRLDLWGDTFVIRRMSFLPLLSCSCSCWVSSSWWRRLISSCLINSSSLWWWRLNVMTSSLTSSLEFTGCCRWYSITSTDCVAVDGGGQVSGFSCSSPLGPYSRPSSRASFSSWACWRRRATWAAMTRWRSAISVHLAQAQSRHRQ